MKRDRLLMAAAAGFASASAFGSAVSMRHDIPGRPLGVSIPLSVPSGLAVGWGAGVAAPWPMPLMAVIASVSTGDRRRDSTAGLVCLGLGIACVAGTLVEPVTYRLSSWTPGVRAAILANVAAAVLLAAAGRRAQRRH
ncbi:MAG: hypothetical protein H0T54_00520 [Geodermatophilaceae bacterium]|nr:hypothetical protein [Geodermatophilaceae bacterium]